MGKVAMCRIQDNDARSKEMCQIILAGLPRSNDRQVISLSGLSSCAIQPLCPPAGGMRRNEKQLWPLSSPFNAEDSLVIIQHKEVEQRPFLLLEEDAELGARPLEPSGLDSDPACATPCCVTLGKLSDLTEPQWPHLMIIVPTWWGC